MVDSVSMDKQNYYALDVFVDSVHKHLDSDVAKHIEKNVSESIYMGETDVDAILGGLGDLMKGDEKVSNLSGPVSNIIFDMTEATKSLPNSQVEMLGDFHLKVAEYMSKHNISGFEHIDVKNTLVSEFDESIDKVSVKGDSLYENYHRALDDLDNKLKVMYPESDGLTSRNPRELGGLVDHMRVGFLASRDHSGRDVSKFTTAIDMTFDPSSNDTYGLLAPEVVAEEDYSRPELNAIDPMTNMIVVNDEMVRATRREGLRAIREGNKDSMVDWASIFANRQIRSQEFLDQQINDLYTRSDAFESVQDVVLGNFLKVTGQESEFNEIQAKIAQMGLEPTDEELAQRMISEVANKASYNDSGYGHLEVLSGITSDLVQLRSEGEFGEGMAAVVEEFTTDEGLKKYDLDLGAYSWDRGTRAAVEDYNSRFWEGKEREDVVVQGLSKETVKDLANKARSILNKKPDLVDDYGDDFGLTR